MTWTPGFSVPTPNPSDDTNQAGEGSGVGGGGTVDAVVPGAHTTVDSTDPANPEVGVDTALLIVSIGTAASPLSDAGTARPTTDGVVYWLMANAITPTNAVDGDIIWNADP